MAALASLKKQCEADFTIVPCSIIARVLSRVPSTFTVAANQVSEQYPPNLPWHPIKG
jgi:hypothetical protein